MPRPHDRPFRFGVALHVPATRGDWIEKCRRAEALGYDTISVADHLGMPAPFPALMLAAEATERVRLGTFMLNAGFYRAALAARDIATTDLLTGGRLELGIGAGQAKPEFEAAGIPYGTGRDRVDHLEHLLAGLKAHFADGTQELRPVQLPMPRLMIAGRGNRILRLAAREADIIGFSGSSSSAHDGSGLPTFASLDAVADRAKFAEAALGDRIEAVEFNTVAAHVVVTDQRSSALERLAPFAPALSLEERGQAPNLLVGTPEQIADQLRTNRERLGVSYVTVLEPGLTAMAPVLELLRGR